MLQQLPQFQAHIAVGATPCCLSVAHFCNACTRTLHFPRKARGWLVLAGYLALSVFLVKPQGGGSGHNVQLVYSSGQVRRGSALVRRAGSSRSCCSARDKRDGGPRGPPHCRRRGPGARRANITAVGWAGQRARVFACRGLAAGCRVRLRRVQRGDWAAHPWGAARFSQRRRSRLEPPPMPQRALRGARAAAARRGYAMGEGRGRGGRRSLRTKWGRGGAGQMLYYMPAGAGSQALQVCEPAAAAAALSSSRDLVTRGRARQACHGGAAGPFPTLQGGGAPAAQQLLYYLQGPTSQYLHHRRVAPARPSRTSPPPPPLFHTAAACD